MISETDRKTGPSAAQAPGARADQGFVLPLALAMSCVFCVSCTSAPEGSGSTARSAPEADSVSLETDASFPEAEVTTSETDAADREAYDAAAAMAMGHRLYLPVWDLAPMGDAAEGLRRDAEGVSGAGSGNAVDAWSAFAAYAGSEYGEDDPRTLAARSRLMRGELVSGGDAAKAAEVAKRAEALSGLITEAFGGDSPEALYARETAGLAMLSDGYALGAMADLEAVAAASERGLGPAHPQTLSARRSLALAAREAGEGPESAARAAEDLALVSKAQAAAFGAEHPERLATERALAETLVQVGDLAAARVTYAAILAALEHSRPPSAPAVLEARLALAGLAAGQGDLPSARSLMDRQICELAGAKGEDHPDTLKAREYLARLLWNAGESADALDEQAGVAETWERTAGDGDSRTLFAWRSLAWLHAAMGDSDAALGILSSK
ncbi:MAG: hypothetical protein LBR80_09230, partial [Deltaproteobacteria bacterium]|nr:hypothetical protein [Deltaproteobacteria bacterium]